MAKMVLYVLRWQSYFAHKAEAKIVGKYLSFRSRVLLNTAHLFILHLRPSLLSEEVNIVTSTSITKNNGTNGCTKIQEKEKLNTIEQFMTLGWCDVRYLFFLSWWGEGNNTSKSWWTQICWVVGCVSIIYFWGGDVTWIQTNTFYNYKYSYLMITCC